MAINVATRCCALALEPLLDNIRLLGLGKALRILRAVAHMARVSAEGQAVELSWIRDNRWDQTDRDYLRMVHQKTSEYTFLTPVTVGAIAAEAPAPLLYRLRLFATSLGLAFQIQDDVLNLTGDERTYGKELAGDLWEGKRTLVLLHALRSATRDEQREATAVLAKPRPRTGEAEGPTAEGGRTFQSGGARPRKTAADVSFLRSLIARYGSVDYARRVAVRRAARAEVALGAIARTLPPSQHLRFLEHLTGYVATRQR